MNAVINGTPVLLALCGYHSRSGRAAKWIAQGGLVLTGADCAEPGCPGEVLDRCAGNCAHADCH